MLVKPSLRFFTTEFVQEIQSKFNAKFICETTFKNCDQWVNQPCALFYMQTKHPNGSNWFAIFHSWDQSDRIVITDGISAVEPDDMIDALENEDGVVVYSVYRHDYATLNGCSIDGGRDYTKTNIADDSVKLVQLKITPEGLLKV